MVLAAIGASLGAGPWQCNALPWPDVAPGAGSGSALAVPPLRPLPPPPLPAPRPPAPAPPLVTPPAPAPAPVAPRLATTPRRDEPTARETLGPKPPPPATRFVFSDEVIVSAVRVLQPTFTACWRRAQRNDPALVTARVRIYLEVDATGAITASRTDAEDARLGTCLANVSRKLALPAPGKAVALELPLYF